MTIWNADGAHVRYGKTVLMTCSSNVEATLIAATLHAFDPKPAISSAAPDEKKMYVVRMTRVMTYGTEVCADNEAQAWAEAVEEIEQACRKRPKGEDTDLILHQGVLEQLDIEQVE